MSTPAASPTAATAAALDLRHAQQLQQSHLQQQQSHGGAPGGDDTNRTTYSATPSEVAAASAFSLRLSARGLGGVVGAAESEDALGVAKDSRYHAARSPPVGATLEQQRAARAAAAAGVANTTSPSAAASGASPGFAHLASRGGAAMTDDYAVIMDIGALDSMMPFPASHTTLPAINHPQQQMQAQAARRLPLATGALAASPGSAAAGQGMGAGFLSNGEARTSGRGSENESRNMFAVHPSQHAPTGASPSQSQPHSSRTSRSMLGSHTDMHSGAGASGASSMASLASFGVGAHTASTVEGDKRRDFRRSQEEKEERAQYDQIRGGVLSQFAGEPASPSNAANLPGGALGTVKHFMLGSGPPGHASAALAASAAAVAAVRPGVKPYVRYAPKYNLPYGDAPRQNAPPPTAAQLAAESKAHEMDAAVIASVASSPSDAAAQQQQAAGDGTGLAQIRSTTLFNLSGALNTHVGINLNAAVFRNHQNLPDSAAASGGKRPGSSAGRPGSSSGHGRRESSATASKPATAGAGRPVSAAAAAAAASSAESDAQTVGGEDGADGGTFLTGVNLVSETQAAAAATARGDQKLVVAAAAAAEAARKEQLQIVTPEDLRAFSALSSVEDAAQWLPRLLRPTRQSIEATEAAARAAALLRTTVPRQRHVHQRPLLPALPLLSIPARVNLPELMDLALDSLAHIPGSHLPGQYAGQAAALSPAKLQAFRGYWLSQPSRAIMHDAYYFVLLYFFKPLPELEAEMGNTAAAAAEKEEERASSAGGATTRRKPAASAGSGSDDEDKSSSARRHQGQGGAPVTLGLNSKSSIARAHALGLDAQTTAHEMFLYRSYAENLRKYAEQEGFQQRQREWIRECDRIRKEQREAHQQIGTQAQQSAAQAAAAQAAAAGSSHHSTSAAAATSASQSQALPGPHTLREDSLLFPPAPVLSTRQKRQPLVLLSDIPQFDVAAKLNTGPVPQSLFEISDKAPPAPGSVAASLALKEARRRKTHHHSGSASSAQLLPTSTDPDYSSPSFLLSSLRSRISQSFVALFLEIHAAHKDFFYLHYFDCLAQLLFYTLLVAYPESRALVNHAFFKKRLLQLLAFWILGFVPSDLEKHLERWRGDIQFITGEKGRNKEWEKEQQAWGKEQAAKANGGVATPQQQQQQQLQPGSEEFEAQLAETLGAASLASAAAAAAAASSSASSSPRSSENDAASSRGGGDSTRDQRNKSSVALVSSSNSTGFDASQSSAALTSSATSGAATTGAAGGQPGVSSSVASSHYVSQLERKLNLHLAASVKSQRQAKAAAAAAAATGSHSQHHHHHQLLLQGAAGISQHMLAHTSMASIIAAQAAAAAAAAPVAPSPTSSDAAAAAAAVAGAAPGTVPSSPGKLPSAAQQSQAVAAQNRPKGPGFDAATGAAQSTIGHLRSITHELTGDLLVDVGERLASGAQDRVPLRVSRRKVTLHHSALVQDFLAARHFAAQSNHALRIPISVPVVGAEAAAAGSLDQLTRFNEARRQESLALRAELNASRLGFARQSVRSKKDLSEIARRFSAEKERALREAGAFSKTLVADYEEKKYHELKAPAKSLALRRLGHFRQTKEDANANSAASAPANKNELSSTLIKATLMM